MPIYEYECGKCGVFEVTQRITEDPLKKCPNCEGKVRRLISHTSFTLKGSGWYATDYARSSKSSTDTSASSGDANGKSSAPESSSSSSTSDKPSSSGSGEKTSNAA